MIKQGTDMQKTKIDNAAVEPARFVYNADSTMTTLYWEIVATLLRQFDWFYERTAISKKNRSSIRLGCFRNAWHDAHFHLNRI